MIAPLARVVVPRVYADALDAEAAPYAHAGFTAGLGRVGSVLSRQQMNIPAGVKGDIVAGREQRALRGDIPT